MIWRRVGRLSEELMKICNVCVTEGIAVTLVCTVYRVYPRIGSPTRCGSSTVMANTGAIPLFVVVVVLFAGGEDWIWQSVLLHYGSCWQRTGTEAP